MTGVDREVRKPRDVKARGVLHVARRLTEIDLVAREARRHLEGRKRHRALEVGRTVEDARREREARGGGPFGRRKFREIGLEVRDRHVDGRTDLAVVPGDRAVSHREGAERPGPGRGRSPGALRSGVLRSRRVGGGGGRREDAVTHRKVGLGTFDRDGVDVDSLSDRVDFLGVDRERLGAQKESVLPRDALFEEHVVECHLPRDEKLRGIAARGIAEDERQVAREKPLLQVGGRRAQSRHKLQERHDVEFRDVEAKLRLERLPEGAGRTRRDDRRAVEFERKLRRHDAFAFGGKRAHEGKRKRQVFDSLVDPARLVDKAKRRVRNVHVVDREGGKRGVGRRFGGCVLGLVLFGFLEVFVRPGERAVQALDGHLLDDGRHVGDRGAACVHREFVEREKVPRALLTLDGEPLQFKAPGPGIEADVLHRDGAAEFGAAETLEHGSRDVGDAEVAEARVERGAHGDGDAGNFQKFGHVVEGPEKKPKKRWNVCSHYYRPEGRGRGKRKIFLPPNVTKRVEFLSRAA